jgi:hypothetical protein
MVMKQATELSSELCSFKVAGLQVWKTSAAAPGKLYGFGKRLEGLGRDVQVPMLAAHRL